MGKFTADCRVVGIGADARYSSLRDPAPPTVYFPASQSTVAAGGYNNNLVFFIRSRNAGDAISAYRGALARFAPNTGYMVFLPLSDQVDQSLGSERLIAQLGGAFRCDCTSAQRRRALRRSGAPRVQETAIRDGSAAGHRRFPRPYPRARSARCAFHVGDRIGRRHRAHRRQPPSSPDASSMTPRPIQISVAVGALLTLISVALLAFAVARLARGAAQPDSSAA